MRISLLPLLVGVLFATVSVSWAAGAEPQPARKKDKIKTPPAVTSQQEAEVMQFLRQHHTELADLLGHLQLSRPADYTRAVRDIWHARERLRQFEKSDRDRYELELQSWVIQSKVQLLVARLAMSENEALRDELRQLLAEQFDLKMRTSQIDRDRTADRLRKLEEQLQRMADNREEMLEKAFLSLTKSSERLKAKRRDLSAAKPVGQSSP